MSASSSRLSGQHFAGAILVHMKAYLSFALLAALVGCKGSSSSGPAPADPFLGHWEASALRTVTYSANGNVTNDQTISAPSQLDVTATTLTFTSKNSSGVTVAETSPYTRNGETLTIAPKNGTAGESYFARSLTSTSFTFEFAGAKVAGKSYYVQTVPYHR